MAYLSTSSSPLISLPHVQSWGHQAISPRRKCGILPSDFDVATDMHIQTLPALFGLYRADYLPKDVRIVGYARTKMGQEDFHKRITAHIKNPDNSKEINAKIEEFKKITSYIPGDYEDGAAFDKLNEHLEEIESHYQSKECNRIFYLALPPTVFIPVAKNLKEHCYVTKGGVNRIIVEKPFGKDLVSSRQLLSALKQYWTEEETFRIDHYLGKEMVKNLLVLRFANVALAAAWDKNYVSNVQITFKEPFGTEGRGGYFDEFGIVRDILQNRAWICSVSVLDDGSHGTACQISCRSSVS
jgi:glucose-6-phosphate 1-dehydrogenase